jgi:peptidyl-tRNA hydrolase
MLPCSALIAAPSPATLYIITRRDLPRGFQAAQIAHAARATEPLYDPHENVVILTVADEAALLALSDVLRNGGRTHSRVREPDAPWNGQLTAIALPPAPREHCQRFLSSLPLLR